MEPERVSFEVQPGREIVIETGKMALLAGGAVTVSQGDTVTLVAACSAKPREGMNFFPLQVDYREKFSAVGKFPGGFFKREGRPTEKEILTARMTDRPLRPLFPPGFMDDVQIMAGLLSADGSNEPDVLSMLGASAALMISDIPFDGPIGALRVGRIDGAFVANPTIEEMEQSDLDLVYAGLENKPIMIEGCADEISEETLRDALAFADSVLPKLIEAQKELQSRIGKQKYKYTSHLPPANVQSAVHEFCKDKLSEACKLRQKTERENALTDVCTEMKEQVPPTVADIPDAADYLDDAFHQEVEDTVRRLILDEGYRADGRDEDTVRPLSIEIGLLPRTHGSALFSRGETQALVCTTLGADTDAQSYDLITGSETPLKRFMLHYNFPNFSVGETGRIGPPGRREIGHGALAERSIASLIPEDFVYTVRCVADILGSNGSSSMASVCGASLSLMDAGVPIKRPVAGISCGLVADESGRKVLLTDILGSEDHYGDMDFKVAGTREGITGFQLDLKIGGLDLDTLYEAMQKNKKARFHLLDEMEKAIPSAREDISPYAPRLTEIQINPEKIGMLIGPGGSMIRSITEETGAQIDIQDSGLVKIFAEDKTASQKAIEKIEAITEEVEPGKTYEGTVKGVKDFGAFVEVLPGQEGLLHISELADHHVDKVTDICDIGDTVKVKVLEIDERSGKMRLSRKAVLADEESS